MMVDRKDYWLNSEYRSWVTDPNDPAVKAERERRKREKVETPPRPILPPIAHRSPALTEALMARYRTEVASYAPKPVELKKPKLKDLIGGWQFG